MPTRLEIAKPHIVEFFNGQQQKVFTLSQLETILSEKRELWQLGKGTTTTQLIDFLLHETELRVHKFEFTFRPTIRYFWGEPNPYELAMSIRPNGYLSHESALHYHRLTSHHQMKQIYVNVEQKPKPSQNGSITQDRIDAAFSRPPRISHNLATWGDRVLYLLNGKNTGMLGVIEDELPNEAITIRTTSIERTLIDIVVRPAYAGGARAILDAYRRASGRFSVTQLAKTLEQLDYRYPYHQSIGFCLERCGGYDVASLDVFRKLPKSYDFYLDHQMETPAYSEEWCLYYPQDL